MTRVYTHVDKRGMRWRFEGSRPISELADEVTDGLERAAGAPCIGCGYCCRKGPCPIVEEGMWTTEHGCGALEWDGSRYWCGLVRRQPALGVHVGGIGSGCSSALFNSDREQIPSPEEVAARRKP